MPLDAGTRDIIVELRLPRVLLAALVGASLAIAGTIFQALFRNPMADPYVLGGFPLGGGFRSHDSFSFPVKLSTLRSGFSAFGRFCRGHPYGNSSLSLGLL